MSSGQQKALYDPPDEKAGVVGERSVTLYCGFYTQSSSEIVASWKRLDEEAILRIPEGCNDGKCHCALDMCGTRHSLIDWTVMIVDSVPH